MDGASLAPSGLLLRGRGRRAFLRRSEPPGFEVGGRVSKSGAETACAPNRGRFSGSAQVSETPSEARHHPHLAVFVAPTSPAPAARSDS